MKLKLTLVLLPLLIVQLSSQAQKRNSGNAPAKYYLDIVRPDCCSLATAEWEKISATLKTSGIPTFFGGYDVLNYTPTWVPVKLRQTQPSEGRLILGPFASESIAQATLYRLPKLLPNHLGNGDERVNGVQPDPFGYAGHWMIGMYQISGFKTSLAIQAQKLPISQPLKGRILEGVIVDHYEYQSWASIVVESEGVKYGISLRDVSETGDVFTIGNHVRITYTKKSPRPERDGTYSLDVTRIVQITTSTRPQTSQSVSRNQVWNERTTDKEIIVDLSGDILFDFNESTIRPDAIPTLQRLARLIQNSGSGVVQLNGHTDSIASDEYNIALSERRAASVKAWLSGRGGIDARRFQTKGYGKSQPIAPNTNPDGSDNPEGRQKNRRVEIRIPK